MDGRGVKVRGFGFQKEGKGSNSRRIHPNDNENDVISIHSIEKNPLPTNTLPQSNDKLLETITTQRQKKVLSNENKSVSSVTSKQRLLIAGCILLSIIFLIVLPTVLGVVLSRNPTVTNPTTSSTVASIVLNAYWGFDNNANDKYGIYNGVVVNGATYSNNTYFGYGYDLVLNASANQSVIVTSPFLNLSYTSFTVEAWIYGYTLTGDNGIFAQCQCTSCQDQCLYLIIRNYKMYMGFTLDDIIGSTSLTVNTWYHVAYVYDYSTQTQSIYVQGVLDGTKTSAGPYQGQSGSLVLGSSPLSAGAFNGFIDNLQVTTRAKSANEILADATVVVYFSFDGSTLTEDMGPNQMNGTLSNAVAASGKVGQGLAFTGVTTSYLQIYGFYELGQSNKPFSFAMWLYPYSINGGVLIQKSINQTSGGWCYSLMGLTYLGQIVMIVYTTNIPLIVGPILSVRTWTHLASTYSSTDGLRMYINGVLFGTTGPVSWSSSGTSYWLTIGSYGSNYCGPSVLYGSPYLGVIDEFYVYRRELNASDVLALANP